MFMKCINAEGMEKQFSDTQSVVEDSKKEIKRNKENIEALEAEVMRLSELEV